MYLNCHSYYSLKYGTLSIEELIQEARNNAVTKLVLSDINNTSMVLRAIYLAKKQGMEIIPGIDFRNGAQQQFVGIAKNEQGFFDLNKLLSSYQRRSGNIPDRAPKLDHCYIIYPWGNSPEKLRSNEFIGVHYRDLNQLHVQINNCDASKLLALNTVSFRNKKDWNIHRLLRAIDTNSLLSQMPLSAQGFPDDRMLKEEELERKYQHYSWLLHQSEQLLDSCSFSFDFNLEAKHNNLKSYTGSKDLDFRLIRKLCYEGVAYRYGKLTETIKERIDKELLTVKEKNFVSYFLIAWKLLKYARSQSYFYVGRGSGANSILAYLLRITDVDPLELDLYFERFINLFRHSPPDFDIDFSWKDREDVTSYLFQRFPNVSLLGAYSTFKGKSIIRELSKVFGLPDHEIKQLQKNLKGEDDLSRLIIKYSTWIQGFPSHLTVHSAGIVISEKPIYHYSATFMPPKGFPTTHFDMHVAEDIGLHKFDILGQRGLAKVKEALLLIKENRKGEEVDVHDINKLKNDPKANGLLHSSSAIGCFYVESPAMRMLLSKLQVDNYLGLVAASSVIRPGVAQSGMMQEYIRRHRDEKRRALAKEKFPVLYGLMPDTYGVMVYQEDVIKVAHYFAGLSLAEADVLRRGMSGKYRSRQEFQTVRQQYFSNCSAKGISSALAKEVWLQIESFAGYAFAKGHSASYAVESYQCLYLKAYYPIEFMVANINNGGGFYSREIYLHEAKKYGAEVHSPCVNEGKALASLNGLDIYLGLEMIQGLEHETVQRILKERTLNGNFLGLRDFVKRVAVSIDQLILLIKAGSFSFSGKGKKELLWDGHFLLSKQKKTSPTMQLFDAVPKQFQLPSLWKHELEDVFDELELIGFPLSDSPFSLLKDQLKYNIKARMFQLLLQKIIHIHLYLVHVKRTSTKDGKIMYFGTFLDLDGEWVDAVIFPPVALRYPFSGPGCYTLKAKVMEEFGYLSLEVISLYRMATISLDDVG